MSELVEIHLLGIPVQLQAEASEHFDELAREFAHLAAGQEGPHREVPERLLALQAELEEQFSGFTAAQEDELSGAIERGDETLDLHYRVPPDVGPGAAALGAMLDEADAYCAAGEYLLTLKTPPGALAYRRWFLEQFVDQAAGAAPVSWAEWSAGHPLEPA
jgi:hypothetical protein